MEEGEFVEGATCSPQFQNESTFDDPDVNLSYLDERVEYLLGHFRKDFEGELHNGKLGAKYGGYGSFLPMYERSVSSNSRTPRYLNNVSTKKINQDTVLASTRPEQSCQTTAVLPLPRASTLSNSSNVDICFSSLQGTEGLNGKSVAVDRSVDLTTALVPLPRAPTLSNSSKEGFCLSSLGGTGEVTAKPVAVDGSVGPFEKKPLKVPKKTGCVRIIPQRIAELYKELGLDSSPSSSEDIPSQSRGSSPNTKEVPDESPMSILEQNMTSFPVPGECLLSPLFDSLLCLMEKPACKELIADKSLTSIPENITCPVLEDYMFPHLSDSLLCLTEKPEERNWELMDAGSAGQVEKQASKESLVDKVPEDRKTSPRNVQSDCREDERLKADGSCALFNSDLDGSKGMQALNGGSVVPSEKKACQGAAAQNQGVSTKSQRMEQSPSGSKKERKESQLKSISSAKVHTEIIRVDLSASVKAKKTTAKTKDIHGDSFSLSEQAEKRSDLLGTLSRDGPKGSKFTVGEKDNQTFTKNPKHNLSGKRSGNSMTSEAYLKAAPGLAPLKGRPVSDFARANFVPGVIKEDWVCCDSCGKWRLLPPSTNADNLQKDEWRCSMLNWLPGMNHCEFSEEDTTNALHELYQLHAPNRHPDAPAHFHQDQRLTTFSNLQKKKENNSDDASNLKSNVKRVADQEGSRVPKKMKAESLYHAKDESSEVTGKPGCGLSKGFPADKNAQKDIADSSSKGSKSDQDQVSAFGKKPRDRIKFSLKRADMGMRKFSNVNVIVPEKSKTGAHPSKVHTFKDNEETCKSAQNVGVMRKSGSGTTSFSTEKDDEKYKGYSSTNDSKSNQKDRLSALVEEPRARVKVPSNGAGMDMGSSGSVDVVAEKRKTEAHPCSVHTFKDNKKKASESAENGGMTRKPSFVFASGLPIKKDGQKLKAYSSTKDSKSDQEGRVSAWAKKPRDRVKVCLNSRSMDMDNSDEVKVVSEKVKMEAFQSNAQSLQDKEESNENTGNVGITRKLGSGVSKDFSTEKGGQKDRAHFSSNDSRSNQKDRVFELATKPRGQVEVSFNGRDMGMESSGNMKVVAKNITMEVCPSDVHTFQDSRDETNESGLNKAMSAKVPKSGCKEARISKGDGIPLSQPDSKVHKENGANMLPVDLSGDERQAPKQQRAPGKQNGSHHYGTMSCAQNGLVAGDSDARTSVEMESPDRSAANEVIREGYELKVKAERLKEFGLVQESTDLAFQAALKFFRGAFLLEANSSELAKHRDITDSMFMYTQTTELCEFVAHEYKRRNEMAAAALAYKCMEVAYMRIIYTKSSSVSQDRHELQMGQPNNLPGDSPSSSVSDANNLNNGGMLDTVTPEGDVSPISGNHNIVAGNAANYERILNSVELVHIAMEASRKCQEALAAASVDEGQPKYAEGLPFVQRAINFSFYDIVGLIRLIQLAADAISDD